MRVACSQRCQDVVSRFLLLSICFWLLGKTAVVTWLCLQVTELFGRPLEVGICHPQELGLLGVTISLLWLVLELWGPSRHPLMGTTGLPEPHRFRLDLLSPIAAHSAFGVQSGQESVGSQHRLTGSLGRLGTHFSPLPLELRLELVDLSSRATAVERVIASPRAPMELHGLALATRHSALALRLRSEMDVSLRLEEDPRE
jgi:hypothetical protein